MHRAVQIRTWCASHRGCLPRRQRPSLMSLISSQCCPRDRAKLPRRWKGWKEALKGAWRQGRRQDRARSWRDASWMGENRLTKSVSRMMMQRGIQESAARHKSKSPWLKCAFWEVGGCNLRALRMLSGVDLSVLSVCLLQAVHRRLRVCGSPGLVSRS